MTSTSMPRRRRLVLTFLIAWVVLVGVAAGPLALADNNKSSKGLSDDIRRQDRQIAEARNKAQGARMQADAARREVLQAKAVFDREVAHTGDVRRSVESQHDSTPVLTAARQQLQQSVAAYEAAAQPIREKLASDPEYQAALARREESKQKLARAGEDQRDAIGREYMAAMAAVRNLEQEMLDADPKVKAARTALTESQSQVQSLVDRRNEAVDRDPKLLEAKRKLDQVKSQLAQAEQKLSGELRQLAAAERKVNQEEQEKRKLQQKQQQEKNNNNKKKNKKK